MRCVDRKARADRDACTTQLTQEGGETWPYLTSNPLMLPLLRMAADAQEHSLTEAREALAADFKLSDAELQERGPMCD